MTHSPLDSLAQLELPHIEIDAKDFQKLSKRRRLGYLAKSFFANSEAATAASIASSLVSTFAALINSVIPSKTVALYTKTVCECAGALGFLPVLSEIVTLPDTDDAEAYYDVDRAFVRVMQVKYGFNPNYTGTYESSEPIEKLNFEYITKCSAEIGATHVETWEDDSKIKVVVGSYHGTPYAAMCRVTAGFFDSSKLYYTTIVYTGHKAEQNQRIYIAISTACQKQFARELNPHKNYVVCDKFGFTSVEKPTGDPVTIVNLPYAKILKIVSEALAKHVKTSIMLVGDPGQGKSTTLFQLMQDLPEAIFVWLRPDHGEINSDYVYATIKALGSCVLVFDDIEACDIASKTSSMSRILLSKLEDTSGLNAVIISTVNEPQLVHPALKRGRRLGDNIYLAENPSKEAIEKLLTVDPKIKQRYIIMLADALVNMKASLADIGAFLHALELTDASDFDADSYYTSEKLLEEVALRKQAVAISSLKSSEGKLSSMHDVGTNCACAAPIVVSTNERIGHVNEQ